MSTNDVEDDEIADLAKAGMLFVSKLDEVLAELNLPTHFIVILFGEFSRRIVAMDIEDGINPEQAHQEVIRSFMRGLGLEAAIVRRLDKPIMDGTTQH
jgi:hypothetical protein